MANPWEMNWSQPEGVQIKPANPKLPFETQKAAAGAQSATAEAPYAGPQAAATLRKTQAEIDAIKRAAAKAASEQQQAAEVARQKKLTGSLQNDLILKNIREARDLIGQSGTHGYAAALSVLPASDARRLKNVLDTIRSNLTFDRLQQMRNESKTGGAVGNASDNDMRLLGATAGSLDQYQKGADLNNVLNDVESKYLAMGADLQGVDREAYAKRYHAAVAPPAALGGGATPPGSGAGGSGPGAPPAGGAPLDPSGGPAGLTGAGKTIADPALAGVNKHVASLIAGGATGDQVRAYLNTVQPGLGGNSANVDAWIKFHKANPNHPIGVNLEDKFVPNTGLQKVIGQAGMTGPGAYFANAADALTLGTLDNMTSNPAMTRATMSGVQQAHPIASMLGTASGGALAAGGLEAGLGRLGVTGLGKVMGSDLLYGSGYGAGSNDDNRLAGAGIGAVAGVGGGMFGRGASRTIGRGVSGVTDAGKRYLANSGIPMTVGQTVGGGLKTFEDRLSGFPLVGDLINARRKEGVQGFNKAAFDEALAPIGQNTGGQIGENGIMGAQGAVSDAYGHALDGKLFRSDPQFEQDIAATLASGGKIPQLGDQFTSMLDNRVGALFDDTGTITGNGFQDAVRGIRQGASAARPEIMGHEFGQAAGQAEDALRGLVQRQSPNTLPAFDNANAAYRNLSILQDAVGDSAKNTDGLFTPAQLGMKSVQNTKNFGGKAANARGDRPFFDLQRAAQNTLPSTIPDSGTAGRYAIPAAFGLVGGIGGAATTNGDAGDRAQGSLLPGLALAAAASAPYSKGAQTFITKALLAERPAAMVQLGDTLINRKRLAGMFASPLLIQANAQGN